MKLIRKIKELFYIPVKVNALNGKVDELNNKLNTLLAGMEDTKMLNANIQRKLQQNDKTNDLINYEFKVFSQYGDDGIIQFLIKKIDIKVKTFIEFGVENYRESNTRFLLMNNNWKGLVIDGSAEHINQIKNENLYWRHDLTAVHKFVTKENINTIFQENGFTGEIGILHIDIDGNDYWVWKEITVINPIIVIMEYNAIFELNHWTVPYDEKFYRTDKHYSNLYFGASLTALNDLAEKKGYSYVGCNSNANNAYFVRNDKLAGLNKVAVNEGFIHSTVRESRDEKGNLNFISGKSRIETIRKMPVFNTLTNSLETI